MQSTELTVLNQALQWLEARQSVVLFTVVKHWGSAPRPLGALLAVSRTGQLVGSVSGGCIEEDLKEKVIAGQFQRCDTLTYGITQEQVERLGLPCGGRLELVAEPLTDSEQVKPVVMALQQRRLIQRQVVLATSEVIWSSVDTETALHYDGHSLTCVFGPAWQLLIIGAGQISHHLAEFALTLDYQIVICDPRQDYAATWQVPGVQRDHRMPDETVTALVHDERSAVVALTHDPRLDDLALLEALKSPAFYIGALGSRTNNAKRLKRLTQLGLSPTAVSRLRAPVGLPIGSRRPPEIAIAILAEMIAVRQGIDQVQSLSWAS